MSILENITLTNVKEAMILHHPSGRSADMQNTSSRQSTLTPAIEHLYDNYTDPMLTNSILAKKAGISEIYFRKLFKERFGITPKQHVIDMRIKKARQLLSENSFSVTEIAEKCGFSSVYHFCRAFKDTVGATPTEYAKSVPLFML